MFIIAVTSALPHVPSPNGSVTFNVWYSNSSSISQKFLKLDETSLLTISLEAFGLHLEKKNEALPIKVFRQKYKSLHLLQINL